MHQLAEHITVAEVAALLGESRWTTQRRIRSGELAAVKPGGGTNPYLIARSEVERFLSERAGVES